MNQIFDVTKLIAYVPDCVKADVIDFNDARMKTGSIGLRVTLCRVLTDSEKDKMRKNKHIVGVDCVCAYRYAPEIKHSYFYVV